MKICPTWSAAVHVARLGGQGVYVRRRRGDLPKFHPGAIRKGKLNWLQASQQVKDYRPDLRVCLFDQDAERLRRTARYSLLMQVVLVVDEGTDQQRLELRGFPAETALAKARKAADANQGAGK